MTARKLCNFIMKSVYNSLSVEQQDIFQTECAVSRRGNEENRLKTKQVIALWPSNYLSMVINK